MIIARNVAIVLAIAAAIDLLPGGGDAAAIVSRSVSLAFIGVIVFGAGYVYRRQRYDLDALPSGYRALAYGAIGALVLAVAAYSRMTSTVSGGLAFAGIVAVAVLALVYVWREHRSLA